MYVCLSIPVGLIHWDNPPKGGLMIQMNLVESINA